MRIPRYMVAALIRELKWIEKACATQQDAADFWSLLPLACSDDPEEAYAAQVAIEEIVCGTGEGKVRPL